MKKLVLEERAGQVGRRTGRAPVPGEAVYIGIDVARSKWVYNVRWDGQARRKLTTPGELKHLQSLISEYSQCKVHVVYEACGFGYEIAWWCQEKGINVLVVAPSTIEQVPGARVKTDREVAGRVREAGPEDRQEAGNRSGGAPSRIATASALARSTRHRSDRTSVTAPSCYRCSPPRRFARLRMGRYASPLPGRVHRPGVRRGANDEGCPS